MSDVTKTIQQELLGRCNCFGETTCASESDCQLDRRAAYRITALEAERDEANRRSRTYDTANTKLVAERNMLRVALEEIADMQVIYASDYAARALAGGE